MSSGPRLSVRQIELLAISNGAAPSSVPVEAIDEPLVSIVINLVIRMSVDFYVQSGSWPEPVFTPSQLT